jgi:hypothetical protein
MRLVTTMMTMATVASVVLTPTGVRRVPLRAGSVCACTAPWRDLSGDGGCLLKHLHSSPSRGAAARERMFASVHYCATLEDGTVLSDSRSGGEPLELRVGMEPSEAVPGWDLALPHMHVGDVAELQCRPQYAFGKAGAPPLIPPNAAVQFKLELLAVRDLLDSNNTEAVDLADRYAHLMAEHEAANNDAHTKQADGVVSDDGAHHGGGEGGASSGGSSDGSGEQVRGRGWIPPKRRVEVQHAKGYSWHETDDEIEVRIPLVGAAARASAASVTMGASTLRVSVLGDDLVAGELCGQLLVQESSWNFEQDGDEAGVLHLDLMKRRATPNDEPLWGYLLSADRDAAVGFDGLD